MLRLTPTDFSLTPIDFTLTPDDFTRQRETLGSERVNRHCTSPSNNQNWIYAVTSSEMAIWLFSRLEIHGFSYQSGDIEPGGTSHGSPVRTDPFGLYYLILLLFVSYL